MSGKKIFWALLFLVTAVTGLILLSSGLSHIELTNEWQFYQSEGDRKSAEGVTAVLDRLPTIPDSVVQILSLSTIIIMPIILLLALLSRESRRELLEGLLKIIPVFFSMYMLVYLLGRLQLGSGSAPAAALAAKPGAPEWITNPSALAAFLISAIFLTLLLVVGWAIWRRTRRGALDLIAQQAQVTIGELRDGRNFKNAIIQCYYGMCRVLSEQRRIERAKSMTPREFAQRLENFGLAGQEAQRLTRLFEAVRYGGQASSRRDRREAMACLKAIVQAAET